MSNRRADAAMLFVVLIWGINFSVMKRAFAEIPPLAFTALRFTAASVLLVPLTRRLEGNTPLPRPTLWRLVVLGILGNTLYQVGFILGLAHTTASNCAVLLAIMPAIVAVLATALGFEPARPRVFWGIALGTAGVVLVTAVRGLVLSSATLVGDALAVSAALCWAGYTVGLRTLPADLSSLRVTTVTTVIGTPGLLLVGAPELMALNWRAVGARTWVALGYATLLSLVAAYILWNRSVRLVGPSRTVVYTCLTPLIATTAAWGLLGERPHPLQGLGAALIIGGVLLTRR